MSSNKIDSIDLLKHILHNKLQEDKNLAEMVNVFISGHSDTHFNVYDLKKPDGTIEPFIDYSISGSLKVGMEADEFVKSIEKIIESWPLSEEVTKILGDELSKLQIRISNI